MNKSQSQRSEKRGKSPKREIPIGFVEISPRSPLFCIDVRVAELILLGHDIEDITPEMLENYQHHRNMDPLEPVEQRG